jgi:membrane protein YdbS with pleckstrin-like domain
MAYYLAADGSPFTDRDAAEFKAERMSAEAGSCFEVIAVDGGFAVANHASDCDESAETSKTSAEPVQSLLSSPEQGNEVVQPFVLSLRPAWRAQFAGILMMILGALLFIAPAWPLALVPIETLDSVNAQWPRLWDDIALLGMVLFTFGLTRTLWRRYYQRSVITNDGVMQSVGIIFNRRLSEVDMSNVHVVDVRQPHILHMLLNLGTVELSTPGSSGADVAIVDVVAPRRLAAFVRDQVSRVRRHHQNTSLRGRNP